MTTLSSRAGKGASKHVYLFVRVERWAVATVRTLLPILLLACFSGAQSNEPKRVSIMMPEDLLIHFADPMSQAEKSSWVKEKYAKDTVTRSDYLFDWRQLQRWKISESWLPAGSVVLNGPPSIWGQYRWYFLGAIFLALAETLLLFGLLWQRAKEKGFQKSKDSSGRIVGGSKIARDITQQKRAEQALRKSEERFRLFMNHSPAVAWMKDAQGHYTYVSESYLEQLGVRLEDRCGKTDLEIYPLAIAEELRKNDQAALKAGHPIEVTEESIGSDGEPCTWLAYKFPFQDASGQVLVGGIAMDITERRKSEETLRNLTGRLIRAQEEERARIARELHDDFSQRLALLGIGLGQLWKKLPASKAEERASVLDLLRGTREISTDLHSLSHQLHSSKLEHVGLVPAVHGLCKEISEKYKIEVHFRECELPLDLPKDVALCLFRVAQEALGNVVKHSRAKSAQVEVDSNGDGISLRISDAGNGFDADKQDPSAGIGLIGMSERLRLVGGTLQVRSGPGHGTEIWAEVPLTRAVEEQLAKTQTAGT